MNSLFAFARIPYKLVEAKRRSRFSGAARMIGLRFDTPQLAGGSFIGTGAGTSSLPAAA
jgi:hypothetical protein